MGDLVVEGELGVGGGQALFRYTSNRGNGGSQPVIELLLDYVEFFDVLMGMRLFDHPVDVVIGHLLQSGLDGVRHFGEKLAEFLLTLVGGLDTRIVISLMTAASLAATATSPAAASSAASFGDASPARSDASPAGEASAFGRAGRRGVGWLSSIIHAAGACMQALLLT